MEQLNENDTINDQPLIGQVSQQEEKALTKSKTLFNRLFGPMSPGSLRGSIFNISILSLGAGCLSIPQKVYYLTLVGSPFFIILAGVINCWTLLLLSSMANKFQMTSYSKLASHLHGKWLSKLLDITIITHILGVVILYQVIIYKLIGGIINEVGNFGYANLDDFLINSFWKEYSYKFPVNYCLALIVLLPLCLQKDISKMRFSSILGISSLFFLIGIIIIQCPMYITDFFKNTFQKDDPKYQYNYYDFSVGFTKDMNFFKSVATLFYAYSCHVGAFPVLHSLNDRTKKRTDKVFQRAIMLDAFCYLVVGMTGYLSMPVNTPDLIIERKSIFESDWIMTIGRISFILTLLMKIPANYNAFRVASLEVMNKSSSEITTT